MKLINLEEAKTKTLPERLILKMTFEIVEGSHSKRQVFEQFLLEGSPKAVQISYERLNKYAKSIGYRNGLDDFGGDLTVLAENKEVEFIGTLAHKEPYNGKVYSTVKKFQMA